MKPSPSVQKQSESTPGYVPGTQGDLSSSDSHSHLFFFSFKQVFCPCLFFFFKVFIYFILLALRVFVAVWGLSLVVASGGYSSLWSMGSSLWWHLLAWSTGSRHASFSSCSSLDSREQAQGLNCSTACEIFPDQGLNPVSCIAKWILNHWITREAPTSHFLNQVLPSPDHPGLATQNTSLNKKFYCQSLSWERALFFTTWLSYFVPGRRLSEAAEPSLS